MCFEIARYLSSFKVRINWFGFMLVPIMILVVVLSCFLKPLFLFMPILMDLMMDIP